MIRGIYGAETDILIKIFKIALFNLFYSLDHQVICPPAMSIDTALIMFAFWSVQANKDFNFSINKIVNHLICKKTQIRRNIKSDVPKRIGRINIFDDFGNHRIHEERFTPVKAHAHLVIATHDLAGIMNAESIVDRFFCYRKSHIRRIAFLICFTAGIRIAAICAMEIASLCNFEDQLGEIKP